MVLWSYPHPLFIKNKWTNHELDGLVGRDIAEGKFILPIWHNIGIEEIRNYSPSLSDKVALKTDRMTVSEIANALLEAIEEPPKPQQSLASDA